MTASRERLRAESALRRVWQSRGLVAPADALHRVAECSQCGAARIEVTVFDAWLTPLGGAPVDDVGALVEALSPARDEPVTAACACGCEAPAAPSLVRYMHAMGRADLALELDAPAVGRRVFLDGSEDAVALDDRSLRAAFGRPLTLRPLWRDALAEGDASVAVEPGHSLRVLRGGDVSAPEAGVMRVGVTAEALSSPPWTWLRDALSSGRHGDVALAVEVSLDALWSALSRCLARLDVTLDARPSEETWTARRGALSLPLAPAAMGSAMVAIDLPLTAFAMREATSVEGRLATVEAYVRAVRGRRPTAPFALNGARLSVEGSSRAIDLLTAPFEDGLDEVALERDLRVLLDERSPWSDATRVCPCGASRILVARIVPRAAMEAWWAEGRDVAVVRALGDSAFEALTLECDRHREPASRALLDAAGVDAIERAHRLEADRRGVRFRLRIAAHRDGEGRLALVAQGADLGSVTLSPDWVRGLLDVVSTSARREVQVVEAWSPHSLIAYDRALDGSLRELLVKVDAMLDPTGFARGADALCRVEVDPVGVARGRFEPIEAGA